MPSEDELLRIPFKWIVCIISGLPLSALAICVVWSTVFHFDSATSTHCEVANWLPSISAAVAKLEPERYIWRIAIGLHAAPRAGIAVAFRNYLIISPLRDTVYGKLYWLANFACFINLAEIMFLMMLSSISSVDNYEMHKVSFIGFLVCAMIYMYLSTYLFDHSGRRRTVSVGEKSFQYKVFCTGASTISLISALYFFNRHNVYCEPGMYTFFALCEYCVVIFNVLFHSTLYYDFGGRSVTLSSSGYNYHNNYQLLPVNRDD